MQENIDKPLKLLKVHMSCDMERETLGMLLKKTLFYVLGQELPVSCKPA